MFFISFLLIIFKEEEHWFRKIYLEQLKVELKKNGEKNSATHIDYIKFVLAEFPPKERRK